jgi:hypothetical protein
MNARIARAAVILSFNPRRYICYWPASTFSGLIAAEKSKLEAQVAKLNPGPQMEWTGASKRSELETASHMNEWLSSPGLQPPT